MASWSRSAVVMVIALGVAGLLAVGAAAGLVTAGTAAPDIARGEWVNSPPLTLGALRGRVVLVEFWTYG